MPRGVSFSVIKGGRAPGDHDTPCEALTRIETAVQAKGSVLGAEQRADLATFLHQNTACTCDTKSSPGED